MNLDSDISDSETHNANIQQRIRRAAHARVAQMEDDLIQYDHYTRAESARRTLSNTLTQLETHILRSAESRSLLKTAEEALEVCRLFNESITGSARVARKLGLRADHGGKVYFP
ncbi:hypothetical protein LTR17_001878 [Elasticomyces elasticus]|nr:hypothetical protein LTR17_001878 [Elasticomyces elasticus]